MNRDFIIVTSATTNAPALIRASAIISVVQDREYANRRVIEYVAGGKLGTLYVQDTTEEILKYLSRVQQRRAND